MALERSGVFLNTGWGGEIPNSNIKIPNYNIQIQSSYENVMLNLIQYLLGVTVDCDS